MKENLIDSLPFTIERPGCYVLKGDLTGVTGQHGLIINASDVTLDLMTFTLIGVPGSLNGVHVLGLQRNLIVHNGTILDWGQHGVHAYWARDSRFEDLQVSNNGVSIGHKALVAGHQCTVQRVVARGNRGYGIFAFKGSTLEGCTAHDNGLVGIGVSLDGTIIDCAASGNGGRGIYSHAGSAVFNCTLIGNASREARSSSCGPRAPASLLAALVCGAGEDF